MFRAGVFTRKVRRLAKQLLSLEEGDLRAVLALIAIQKEWMYVTITQEQDQYPAPVEAVITPKKDGYGYTDFDGTSVQILHSLPRRDNDELK